jgi:hypothetical protein
MPENEWFPSYRDELFGTLYPLAEDATLVTQNGLTLDRKLFLDAALYPIGAPKTMAITSITIDSSYNVSLEIGGGANPTALLAVCSMFNLPTGNMLKVYDKNALPGGVLLINPDGIQAFQTWPVGKYKLLPNAAPFVASVCHPVPPQAVNAIVVNGVPFTHDVTMFADFGVVLSATSLTLAGEMVPAAGIMIHTIGEVYANRATCADSPLFKPAIALTELMFVDQHRKKFVVKPDHSGNLNINVGDNFAADTALRITAVDDTITFTVTGMPTTSYMRKPTKGGLG